MDKKSDLLTLERLHGAAKTLFTGAGYEWEIQTHDGVKLGLWRNQLRSTTKAPRRFVLLPGFGDTPLSWLPVLIMLRPILGRHYDEIVVFDFPGFQGFLAHEPCAPSMDVLISATRKSLIALKPHTLLGHSLGGWLAGYYAVGCKASSPERLILACPAGVFGSQSNRNRLRETFVNAAKEQKAKAARYPLEGCLFAHEPAWFKLVSKEFAGFITRDDVVQFMLSLRDDHAIDEQINSIRSKTWLLWGEIDTLIPSAWVNAWLKGLTCERKAVFVLDSGHGPHIEKPAVTAAILTQILSGSDPHPAGKRWWKLIDQPQ